MKYKKNKAFFEKNLNGGFDISKREIILPNHTYYICFINSLSDAKQLLELVKGLYQGKGLMDVFAMYCASSVLCEDKNQALNAVLSGQCILLHEDEMYLIEVRSYPNQISNEASNEQSIRGSHDSFVENIILNVGLIRRRIRDPKLKIRLHQEGDRSKNDIAYLYIEDLVDKHILNDFKNRLNNLKSVEVMYERTLCDALYGKSLNPYPRVRFCERPDICAIHLLQGYLVVLVDNCFTAIILPTTFFELTKQIEEYTQVSIIAIFIRLVRLLAIFLSVYLLPIWITIQSLHNSTMLNIPILEIKNTAFFIFQIITIEMIIEWIRLSYIHTPQSISGIMGFLFVFLLGESAIKINVYTEVILVLVVLCNVCNFVTPNYELSLANKLFRVFISVLCCLWNITGFAIGIFIHFCTLIYTKNNSSGYLYPFIPFDYKEIKRLLIGTPIHYHKKHD